MYTKYIKRPLDFCLSLCALIVLSPILLVLSIVGDRRKIPAALLQSGRKGDHI